MAEKEAPQVVHISDIRDLFTKDRAENGIDLDVLTPTGEKTDGTIKICGADSKLYKKRSAEIMRRYGDLDPRKPPEGSTAEDVDAKIEERDLELACAFVIGWSLPCDFSPENVHMLLENTTALRARVVNYGIRRELFFAVAPKP